MRAVLCALMKKLTFMKTWLVFRMTQPLASGEKAVSTTNMPRHRIAQCARARTPSAIRMGRFLFQSAALESR